MPESLLLPHKEHPMDLATALRDLGVTRSELTGAEADGSTATDSSTRNRFDGGWPAR
jgi:hypothetical protein